MPFFSIFHVSRLDLEWIRFLELVHFGYMTLFLGGGIKIIKKSQIIIIKQNLALEML